MKVTEKKTPIVQEHEKSAKPINNPNSPWRQFSHVQKKPEDPVDAYFRDRSFWRTINRQST